MSELNKTQNRFVPILRNYSLTLSSFYSRKTLNEIKYQKNITHWNSSNKRLKSIKNDLEKLSPNRDTLQKIIFIKTISAQRFKSQENQNLKKILPSHLILKQKVISLAKSLFLDLQVFKKIQFTVRRQKSVISKLYGWDEKFGNIFFQGQQIKASIDGQYLQKSIFSGKLVRNDSQLKVFSNKLRFFQAQLRQFNHKQQAMNVRVKGKNLEEKIGKLMSKINNLQSPRQQDCEVVKKVRQFSPNKSRKSLRQILRMDNCQQELGLNNFELKLGEDFDTLQSIVDSGYRV